MSMFSASNVLQIGPIGNSPIPANGVNPVITTPQAPPTANFVYYKFIINGQYSVAVAPGFTLNKLYYTIVGNGGLGGAKSNSNQPSQGSCGGGGGGGLVFPLNAFSTATPPINISGVRNFSVFVGSRTQSNEIYYQDISNNNIFIQALPGTNGFRGNTGPPPTSGAGATGGNGGAGGMNQVMSANTFASSGGFGGIGGAGNPPSSGSPAIIGPPGSRGSSQPSGSTGLRVTFADNNTAEIGTQGLGAPGAGGDNSSNPRDGSLGSGQGGELGFVLLYYNVNDVGQI